MIEIDNLFNNNKKKHSSSMSLIAKLEAFVGNYFLSEITYGSFRGLWNTVYFNPNINNEIECVECIPENLIGYVDRQERWAFIIDTHIQKFIEDTVEYELEYLAVPSMQEEILRCSHVDNLPSEFSNLIWIDDDFMEDEHIPFDFAKFAIIDEGRDYLNPKHFSVNQLIKVTQKLQQKS